MTLTIGSLFSGIGGLELGLEWAGLGPVVFQCEIDPFCRAVLAKHWPHVERFEDVTARRQWPHVDVLCGGFPCQDVSSAGKRRGLGGVRSGLWYHFARVVSEVRPRFVVVENVASGASRWLRPVRHGLHVLGYRTRALGIAASDCGAPHIRKRVFVIAYAHGERSGARVLRSLEGAERAGRPVAVGGRARAPAAGSIAHADPNGSTEHSLPIDAEAPRTPGDDAADADRARREGSGPGAHEERRRPPASGWRAPQPDILRVADGLSRGLDSPRRRIKALGNAVVPACAQVAGEVIRQLAAMGPS